VSCSADGERGHGGHGLDAIVHAQPYFKNSLSALAGGDLSRGRLAKGKCTRAATLSGLLLIL